MQYSLNFNIQVGETETNTWEQREYFSERQVIRAALTIFRHRSTDPNDELYIYEGRINAWGSAKGRCLGKIAYNVSGIGYRFFATDNGRIL